DAPGYRSPVDSRGVSCGKLCVFSRVSMGCFEVEGFALRSAYRHRVRLAQLGGRPDEGIEHRLEVEGRAADDLEHVGGGGLLLERFAQLVEQARVLYGDDGLGGEVLHQLNLLDR